MLVPPALAVGHPTKTWYPSLFAGDGAANCWQSRLPSLKIIWLNGTFSKLGSSGQMLVQQSPLVGDHPADVWYSNPNK